MTTSTTTPDLTTTKALTNTLLIAALLAAAAGWLGGEAVHGRFDFLPPNRGQRAPTPAEVASDRAGWLQSLRLTSGIAYGALGGAMGLVFGILGGWSRRSARATLSAGALGLLLGGIVGAGVTYLIVPFNLDHNDNESKSILVPLLVHAAIWCSIGLTTGLALAFGRGGGARALLLSLLGSLLGVVLGTLLFEILGLLAFPLDRTTELSSASWASRLFANEMVAIGCALGLMATLPKPPPEPAERASASVPVEA